MSCLQGKEHVPDTVDHVQVPINPQEDRSWLQSEPKAITDNVHTFDTIGPQLDTRENWSEAVKRLKQRVLQRVIDTYKMEQCLIFCRWELFVSLAPPCLWPLCASRCGPDQGPACLPEASDNWLEAITRLSTVSCTDTYKH